MHGFDFSVPHFLTHIQGTRIAATPQIVANVLRVPRVEFLDYLSYERLRTVSKDELKWLSVSGLLTGVSVNSLTIQPLLKAFSF